MHAWSGAEDTPEESGEERLGGLDDVHEANGAGCERNTKAAPNEEARKQLVNYVSITPKQRNRKTQEYDRDTPVKVVDTKQHTTH